MKRAQSKQAIQEIRSALLLMLNDAEFHSGEDLADAFSLSRSAISNHIKALCELGIEIYSVKGRGYKLSFPIDLLNASLIAQYLPATKHHLLQVENLVTSTNDLVKQLQPSTEKGHIILAEAQSAGRGRRGRTWVSPFGSSLYMSMLWRFEQGYQAMSGLSLMIGVVLNNTLQQMGVKGCQLKWPNDVYFEGKKLAGILIEVEGQAGSSTSAIIGVGLNVNLPNDVSGIDQAFTDLSHISVKKLSRNELAARFIENLWKALPQFEAQGLHPFLNDWQTSDLFFNKPIKLLMGNKSVQGISKGIDASGALLLESAGTVTAYHGGEISVRSV